MHWTIRGAAQQQQQQQQVLRAMRFVRARAHCVMQDSCCCLHGCYCTSKDK
jgi:hypothetical protein